MRPALLITLILAATACTDLPPTAPTNGQIALSISQADLPSSGTATVTAIVRQSSGALVEGALVRFNSSMGTFSPPEAFTRAGIATTTFTATRNGIGSVGALSGSVPAEPIQVRIGEFPTLPTIDTTPPPPTVFVSCHNSGTAGVALICSLSGSSLASVVLNWGDGAPEESVSPTASSVAHVYGRAGLFTVHARGVDGLGRVATASTIATIHDAPEPLPPAAPPAPIVTTVSVGQEANVVGGCAVFFVGATAATGRTITSLSVEHNGVTDVLTPSFARVAICGLVAGNVVTGKATDNTGFSVSYPLIVK